MEKLVMHCLYIQGLPEIEHYFREKQLPKKMVKISGHIWSTIYSWIMLPSGRKPRVGFLKILAMIWENCQSHHVFIMGRDPNCNRNKIIDRSHMELYLFAAKKLSSVLKAKDI